MSGSRWWSPTARFPRQIPWRVTAFPIDRSTRQMVLRGTASTDARAREKAARAAADIARPITMTGLVAVVVVTVGRVQTLSVLEPGEPVASKPICLHLTSDGLVSE